VIGPRGGAHKQDRSRANTDTSSSRVLDNEDRHIKRQLRFRLPASDHDDALARIGGVAKGVGDRGRANWPGWGENVCCLRVVGGCLEVGEDNIIITHRLDRGPFL